MSSHECFSPLCLPCLTFGTGATTYQSQQQHTKIPNFKKINYLNRGAQDIDIVALSIDFVAVRAWAQSVCRLE